MKHFLVSSSHRTTGTSDRFTIDFVTPIEGKFLVKYILIPNTLYNIDEKKNVIAYFDSANRQVVIPPGSYTGSTLATAIKTAMDATSAPTTYTVTYNTINGRLTLSPSVGTFYFRFGTLPTNTAAKVMGFPVEDNAAAASHTSLYPVNLSYPTSLALRIEEAAVYNLETAENHFFHVYIPFDVTFGYYRSLGADVLPQVLRFISRSKRLTIRVYDTDGNAVSLNNGDFEILLQKLC
jgi:hypothetical protein